MQGTLVYVHVGLGPVPHLPDFLDASLRYQSEPRAVVALSARHPLFPRLHTDGRITAVDLDDLPLTPTHRRLRVIADPQREFRSGFWRATVERFFVLEELAAKFGLSNFIHLENDNVAFFDAPTMAKRLAPLYPGLRRPSTPIGAAFPGWCLSVTRRRSAR